MVRKSKLFQIEGQKKKWRKTKIVLVVVKKDMSINEVVKSMVLDVLGLGVVH